MVRPLGGKTTFCITGATGKQGSWVRGLRLLSPQSHLICPAWPRSTSKTQPRARYWPTWTFWSSLWLPLLRINLRKWSLYLQLSHSWRAARRDRPAGPKTHVSWDPEASSLQGQPAVQGLGLDLPGAPASPSGPSPHGGPGSGEDHGGVRANHAPGSEKTQQSWDAEGPERGLNSTRESFSDLFKLFEK